MSSPYRDDPERTREGPEDEGLVSELVRQFQDPYAFVRELVQNSIDAGATRIDVRVVSEPEGTLAIGVADDGSGMDRETIEDKLLVLFRSSKEGVAGKIGKFGIGFVSVLGVDPDVVEIETHTGQLPWHLAVLHPDHRYELFAHESERPRGTTVRLRLSRPAKEHGDVLRKTKQALERWCGHARVEIVFSADGATNATRREPTRIDRPFELDGPIAVRGGDPSAGIEVVVGVPERGAARIRFYNRGLLLHEMEPEAALAGIDAKVMHPGLGHTLARDSVRKDAAYDEAMRLVGVLAKNALPAELLRRLDAAAETNDRGAYASLAHLLAKNRVRLPAVTKLPLLLLEPIRGSHRGHLPGKGDRKATSATASDACTRALAAEGVAVVDLGALSPSDREGFEALLRRSDAYDRGLLETLSHVTVEAPTATDGLLLDALASLLDAARRAPDALLLGLCEGAKEGASFLVAPSGFRDGLVRHGTFDPDPMKLLGRKTIVLNTAHALVASARARATTEPTLAAHALATAIFAQLADLGEKRSEKLLSAAQARIRTVSS
ncbi:MAG: ATP-binding protein [Polyangiales bacterium]